MNQKNNSINRYSIASVLFCIFFQVTIITLEAKTKPVKNFPIDINTQNLIRILRNDNTIELQAFINEHKDYDFNKLRNGLWTKEKSTALIECIVLDAYNCLNLLLSQDKFKNKVLKKKSSSNLFALDYALNPKVKERILSQLLPYYKSHDLEPKNYISQELMPVFEEYQKNDFAISSSGLQSMLLDI